MQIPQSVNLGMMQRNDCIIYYAHADDAKQIAKIEAECFSSPWSENQIEEEINNIKAIFLTAKTDSTVCGYVSGQLILDEFYISNIAVKDQYRNKGLGTLLLKKLIQILYEKSCSLVTLEVRESNFTARRLYENLGFIDLGIRKDFYSFPKENAHIYTLYLSDNTKESLS